MAQTKKDVYKNLINSNISLYDIKDSTIFIVFRLYDSFRGDTVTIKQCILTNSIKPNNHDIFIATHFHFYHLNQNILTHQSLKTNNFDDPDTLQGINFNKANPHNLFYLMQKILKKEKGDFDKKKFGKYTVTKTNDTFILHQEYKKGKRSRKIYFKKDYKIFRVEVFNYNEEEPDAYLRIDFNYYAHNCFDSLNKIHLLGHYTPYVKTEPLPVINDTITKTSKFIYTFGTADSILVIDTNKYYIFDYWYLSCSPCLQMMPFMNFLHEKTDTGKLVIIGVNPYNTKESILKYLEKRNYHFLQLDKEKNVPMHSIQSFPTLIILDGHLNVVQTFIGYQKNYTEYYVIRYLKSIDRYK